VELHENAIKQIIEMLNAGDYDAGELFSTLKTERSNRKDVSEIIGDVWPEIVTDKARHGFCEALVEIDVKPQIICEEIYLPWVCTATRLCVMFFLPVNYIKCVHWPFMHNICIPTSYYVDRCKITTTAANVTTVESIAKLFIFSVQNT